MNQAVIQNNSNVLLPFLYGKIEQLPYEMQKEVSLFTDFLISKTTTQIIPKFGSLKGKVILSADFDASLEDFKDYM